MAGGRFEKYVGKDRPGTYINFNSGRTGDVLMGGTRGTVIIPLYKADYGPAGQMIKLTAESPDAADAILGYSIYDDDANRQMLLIREAFKRATTVYVYILAEGDEAQAEITMALPGLDPDENNEAILKILKESIGKNGAQAGCNLDYNTRTRTITVTLLGPLSGVKNTGVIVAAKALKAQSYSISIDGITFDDLIGDIGQVMASPLYKRLSSMKAGDADVRIPVTISKEGASVDYTVVISYPKSAPSLKQGLTEETPTTNTMKAVAKYGGTRGNTLTVTVDANPLGGFDVIVHRDGVKVAEYEALKTVEELIEQADPYITFTGKGELGEAVGTNLYGGTDGEVTNAEISNFVDAWDSVKFQTVAFPFDGQENENIKQAALTKIKYMRESMGKGVQAVIPNAGKMDYEGIINVTNSVVLGDKDNPNPLSVPEVCAWVAGATAGATHIQSLTYIPYAGAYQVNGPKSNDEAIEAIKNGEFFFSVNEDDEVVVEYDINSLTTFPLLVKDKSYRKNKVIRVFDSIQETIQLNFPPNKYANSTDGWDIMEGIGKTVLRMYEDIGAIQNVDYDNDFLVDRELSKDDEVYFNVGIQAVDSAEKLYFTITTR